MIVDRILKWLSENEGRQDPRLVFQIEKLAGWAFQRQFLDNKESDRQGKLYISHAGKCPRQIAYGYHGIEKNGKEIDSRANINFWLGDMSELMLIHLAKAANCGVIASGFDQLRIELPLKSILNENGETQTISASGYADGLLLADKKLYLIEAKSFQSFSYDAFEKGEIDEAYLAQINMYMDAYGIGSCILIGLNKNNGVIGERLIEKDEEIIKASKDNLVKVIDSTPESLPERKYKANEKGVYPWNCRYCGWFKTCLPDAELILQGKNYILKNKKEV